MKEDSVTPDDQFPTPTHIHIHALVMKAHRAQRQKASIGESGDRTVPRAGHNTIERGGLAGSMSSGSRTAEQHTMLRWRACGKTPESLSSRDIIPATLPEHEGTQRQLRARLSRPRTGRWKEGARRPLLGRQNDALRREGKRVPNRTSRTASRRVLARGARDANHVR